MAMGLVPEGGLGMADDEVTRNLQGMDELDHPAIAAGLFDAQTPQKRRWITFSHFLLLLSYHKPCILATEGEQSGRRWIERGDALVARI